MRPTCLPLCLATYIAAEVRSAMIRRSHCAIEAMTLATISPTAVEVSTLLRRCDGMFGVPNEAGRAGVALL